MMRLGAPWRVCDQSRLASIEVEVLVQRSLLMLDNLSQTIGAIHRLKEEIDKLTRQQSEALQLATRVGMTPDEAEEYDQRRKKILEYVQDLKILEESQ